MATYLLNPLPISTECHLHQYNETLCSVERFVFELPIALITYLCII